MTSHSCCCYGSQSSATSISSGYCCSAALSFVCRPLLAAITLCCALYHLLCCLLFSTAMLLAACSTQSLLFKRRVHPCKYFNTLPTYLNKIAQSKSKAERIEDHQNLMPPQSEALFVVGSRVPSNRGITCPVLKIHR